MKLYSYLARKRWPVTYEGKILLVSFIGVHVPMFGAVSYALIADPTPIMAQLDVLAAMLLATLLGTGATLFVMHSLLSPVRTASKAAQAYLKDRTLPRLPVSYEDEAGILMSSLQECIIRLDSSIASATYQYEQLEREHSEKFNMLSGMKHDFRTPLTHILGFSALLQSSSNSMAQDPQTKAFVKKISASGEALLQTLNSVLEMSDVESRRQIEEDSELCNLTEIVNKAIDLEHLHSEKAGVSVAMDTPGHQEVFLIRSAAETLVSTMLHAATCAASDGGSIEIRTGEGADGLRVTVHSNVGQFHLEDVPQNLAYQLTDLESNSGTIGRLSEASTPITLRLSLIDTLAKALGGEFVITQSLSHGINLTVMIPQAGDLGVSPLGNAA
ncbi:MAG: hypothetical protein CML55_06945 [Rhodobacteraceae bacterium]|nr:hypothetical protein [Paracoccaceae bacterium]